MNLQGLFQQKAAVNEVIKQEKEKLKELDALISEQVQEEFAKSRNKKDKHFGALSLSIEGMNVKQTVSKKIDWDQEALAKCSSDLVEAGMNPTDFLTVKYGMSETVFNKLPEEKREYFAKARTEKQGTVKIEVVEK